MGAVLQDLILGSLTISQCSQASEQTNNEVTRGTSSGSYLSEATFLNKSEPTGSWTTSDLFNVLGGISLTTGLCISSGTILTTWATQACAGDMGTGNHLVRTATNAFAIVQSISARQGETATATIEGCFLSTTGFASPLTSVVNGNLTSQEFQSEYRLGPVKINGTTLTGVTGFTINPNIKYEKRYTDGGVYPTHTFLMTAEPTIDVTFENQIYANTYGPIFLAMSSAVCYLRKKAEGGTVVADATAGHLAISFGSGIISMEQISGQGRTPAEVTLRLHGLQLAVNTATAIS